MKAIEELLDIMRQLRDPEQGCPWDLQQDFRSIAPFTVEEAYEVADAIEREALDDLKDELGDLLFQVVFHAQMAAEQGAFEFEDVARAIRDKMVRRHPHVFGERKEHDAETQTRSWEAIKAEERRRKAEGDEPSALDGVSVALPGLTRALKLQKRAARVGFDWDDIDGVYDKIREELEEVRVEVEGDAPHERIEDEIGDLFFACSNLARFVKVDPEAALRRANAKFERRFRAVEERIRARGEDISAMSLDALEAEWQAVKRLRE